MLTTAPVSMPTYGGRPTFSSRTRLQSLSPSDPVTSSSTSLGWGGSGLPSFLPSLPEVTTQPLAWTGLLTLMVAGGVFWKYRGAIQYRFKILQEESWIFGAGVTMKRVHLDTLKSTDVEDSKQSAATAASAATPQVFGNLQLLELNPDFVHECQEQGWKVVSLGDYLKTLRPQQLPSGFEMSQLPRLVQREVEAGLAAGLLRVLGPNLGRALLPLTGLGAIQHRVKSLAANVVTNWFLNDDDDDDGSSSGSIVGSDDKGGVPISLLSLLAASDLNARFNSGRADANPAIDTTGFTNMNRTAIEKMIAGEVIKGPSIADVVPPDQTFIISRDFDKAIHVMEHRLFHAPESGETDVGLELARNEVDGGGGSSNNEAVTAKADPRSDGTVYDPDDRRLPDPVPVNERLFPGLHLGHGQAMNSHTKREVMKMRLLSVLMNRLGANYHKRTQAHHDDADLFTVQMDSKSKPITTPGDFMRALMEAGHHVEAAPTTHLTTFGINLCLKEEDGSWSHVPMAVFLESGYEDQTTRMAPAMMPHSGLDLYITGPVAGTRSDGTPSTLRLQHFNGIEGFCGWHPNDHPVVPFNKDVEMEERLHNVDDIVRAVRLAGLYASVLNGLSTQLKLPFGGYGLTAVCNDSAALVQQCLYGETTIFPLTSVGRYMLRTRRYAQHMADQLVHLPDSDDLADEVIDLTIIADALKKIPSDLQATPGNAENAARRMLATLQPNLPFLLAKESKQVMEAILKEEEETKVFEHIRMSSQTSTDERTHVFSGDL